LADAQASQTWTVVGRSHRLHRMGKWEFRQGIAGSVERGEVDLRLIASCLLNNASDQTV
jgi:hypothetical protein